MYKKIIYLTAIVIVSFFVNSCQQESIAPPSSESPVVSDAGNGCTSPNLFCGTGNISVPNSCNIQNPTTIELWVGVGNANAGSKVGDVSLLKVGNNLQVTYNFLPGQYAYVVSEIHFDIADSYEELHQNKSFNPVPGSFDYVHVFSPAVFIPSFTFTVPLPADANNDGKYFIAAHAGSTYYGGIQGFEQNLPTGCVTISNLSHDFNNAYWSFTLGNAGFLTGQYYGWCIDLSHGLGQEPNLYNCAQIFSSYGTLPDWLTHFPYVEQPENFDKINYLVNHFNVGQQIQLMEGCTPTGVSGQVTAMDIQAAIWYLMDEPPLNLEEWAGLFDMQRVNAILCDVNANGEGFVPSCANNDYIVFIVYPDPATRQGQAFIGKVLLSSIPCQTSGGTVWADGKDGANFLGNNWGTYFLWKPNCP